MNAIACSTRVNEIGFPVSMCRPEKCQSLPIAPDARTWIVFGTSFQVYILRGKATIGERDSTIFRRNRGWT
jgi:hypothetical protein